MVGRRSRVDENRSITPDEVGRGSPRSRKCLDMAPSELRSPLLDRSGLCNGLRSREDYTPHKGEKRKVEEPGSPEIFPRTPAQFSVKPFTPISTPRSVYSATPQRSVIINTPRRSRSGVFTIPEQFRIAPLSHKKEKPEPANLPRIEAKSFYNRSVEVGAGDSNDFNKNQVKKDELKKDVNRAGDKVLQSRSLSEPRVRPSIRRETSFKKSRSSLGGVKRKREGTNKGGFGHAIKRPKKKLRVDIKISDLPAMSIEIPGSKVGTASRTTCSPVTPTPKPGKKAVTPKTGNFSVSRETKVDYEVKGGQIVYRKGGSTPVRRSPRKHLSPMKQSYFQGGGRPKARLSGKLFSPQADFLSPEILSPVKNVPSPVKFAVAPDEEETETNISDLIHGLEEEEEEGGDLQNSGGSVEGGQGGWSVEGGQGGGSVDGGQGMDHSRGPTVFIDTDAANSAYAAVQDILGELSTGTASDSSSLLSETEEEEERNESGKLYPIFYKDQAQPGTDRMESKRTGKLGYVCQDPNQMQIDAGQERGPTLCLQCGTVYTKGDPVDESSHDLVHSGLEERLRFSGWRRERNCGEWGGDARVLMVQPGDPAYMWRKVEEALAVVDRDLGFSEVGIRYPERTKVFLYIQDKTVVGLLLAESIQAGYRVFTQQSATGKLYMCSETGEPVQCGVSRIWVHAAYRRKGVATRLVESMRTFFILGEYLGQDQFAFSDPTLNGMDFATSYMKRRDFLVYNR